jgi:hypothetical protein
MIYAHIPKVDKLEQMLGSYGPSSQGKPYIKDFDPDESPSGMLARSGQYYVKSRVVDDDGEVYAGTCSPTLYFQRPKPEHFVTATRMGVVLQALEGVVKRDKQTGFADHNSNYRRVFKYLLVYRCWIHVLLSLFLFSSR